MLVDTPRAFTPRRHHGCCLRVQPEGIVPEAPENIRQQQDRALLRENLPADRVQTRHAGTRNELVRIEKHVVEIVLE